MFHATFTLGALFVAGVSAIEYDAINCDVTNAVTIKGILSDVFCTDKSLADPDWKLPISSTSLLTAPETHKFACFYEMKGCRDSGYDLLVEGADSTYEIGHRLSNDLNDKVRAFLVGLPDEVKTQAGFVVQITGAVVYDHDDDSAAFGAHCGDEISIIGLDGTEGSAGLAELLAGADYSGGSGDDDGDDDECTSCVNGCDAAYSSVKSELPPTLVEISEAAIASDASVCATAVRTECDSSCGACSPTGDNMGTDQCPMTCVSCGDVVMCEASETLSTCKVACCSVDESDDSADSTVTAAASAVAVAAALVSALW